MLFEYLETFLCENSCIANRIAGREVGSTVLGTAHGRSSFHPDQVTEIADVLDVSPEAASRLSVVIASDISSIPGSTKKDGLVRGHLKTTLLVDRANGHHGRFVDFEHSGRAT